MDASPLHRPSSTPEISRRRLLRLAGTSAVAAATVNACSKVPAAGTSSAPAPRSVQPSPAPSALAGRLPVPAAPAADPVSGVVLCREAWGAAPARPGGTPHTLNSMTIHHTAVLLGDNPNAPARLRQHQRYHQDSQGWIDIAYHLSVDRNGNIYQLRDPALIGDTATNYDPTGHFLVVCEGDFDKERVTEEQLNGAALAFAWAATRYGIPTDTLAGHRDESPETTCPGASLYAHVTSGDLEGRINGILAAGPVDLPILCGPEADARVAEIESGSR